MKLRYKILLGFVTLISLAVVSLAITMSYTTDCGPAPQADSAELVQVIENRCYGSPDVLELNAIAKPVPGDDEVLIRVRAASVNPLDWHYMRGSPYVMRFASGLGKPTNSRLGADFAGVVEAVGSGVSKFKVGDKVFGTGKGAFGEYLTKHQDGSLAIIPDNTGFADAAAVPIAGITALQAVRDYGQLEAGQQVLVNGASGGVGTYVVQIAKAYGATVTGVSSKRNHEMVRSIGADHMIDYREENYTEGDERFDLVVDMIGNHSFTDNLGVLKPDGRLVIVGGQKGDWIGPLTNMMKRPFVAPFVEQEVIVMLARTSAEDLTTLANLLEEGSVVSVIDRTFSLGDTAAAIAYSEEGRARGKIIIEVAP